MASAAAVSTLQTRPPRLHPSQVTSAHPVPTRALPFLRRRHLRPLTTAYAVQNASATSKAAATRWTAAPVSAIGPATDDKSIFLITLDLSTAPDLVDAYTTPGQYLLTRVPSAEVEKLKPAFMVIASAPRTGLRFDLLAKSVPGTTAERLCMLSVGDVVELGPVTGKGLAIQNLYPPKAAETVLIFAVGTGISSIRSLIEFGFAANERADVRLYYGASNLQAMPFQEEFKKWEKTGVNVIPVLSEQVQDPFLKDQENIILNPDSTGAVLAGPSEMQEEITGALLDRGVPHDKILTI